MNRYRRCRLCAASRREAHLSGDPHWQLEPGQRGGIQLFFGDLYNRNRGGRGAPGVRDETAFTSPDPVVAGQLRLLEVAADPRRLPPLRTPITTVIPDELAAAIGACAEARGWKKPTTDAVREAIAVLVELGSLTLTGEAVSLLRRRRLPVTRVREFLAASGLEVPAPDQPDAWLDAQTRGLPARIRDEVAAWVEVLDGRWGRAGPRSSATIRHYLNAARPALVVWGAELASLREVTTDDITGQLADLHGSQRTMTAVALRSLFGALKARRLVFADPTRAVHPGRFPQRPVLGLDDHTRRAVLPALARPDHRLVVLLAGIHALRRGQIIALETDDVDLDAATILVDGRRRPLGSLVAEHVVDWLRMRRDRWPASANPHLLITYKSAYGLGPVSTSYIIGIFADLPTTAAGLRADRLLAEAQAHRDPLLLARLFGLSAETAVRYCAEVGLPIEDIETTVTSTNP